MRAIPLPPVRSDLRAVVQRHPLAAYVVAAYAISWAIALPLAAVAQGALTIALPPWLHYGTAFGPALAALLVTWVVDGPQGLRSLGRRVLLWRIGLGWLLVAAVSPVALYALIAAVLVALGAAPPDLRGLGTINFLPYLGPGAWLFWIMTSGLGEEVGWRGFALPRLQQRHGALTATLLLGCVWALWHLPFFLYLPNFRALGLLGFPSMALGIMCGAILLTWLYNSTRGSVLATILWHGAFNFVTASAAGQGTVAMIMSVAVMVWAVLIVALLRPARLSRAPRQTGT